MAHFAENFENYHTAKKTVHHGTDNKSHRVNKTARGALRRRPNPKASRPPAQTVLAGAGTSSVPRTIAKTCSSWASIAESPLMTMRPRSMT